MKTNRGFTLIELMLALGIIAMIAICIMATSTILKVMLDYNNKARQAFTNSIPVFVVGDTVALSFPNNVMITGKVSRIPRMAYPYYSVMIVGSNGIPTTTDNIPASIRFIRKIEPLER